MTDVTSRVALESKSAACSPAPRQCWRPPAGRVANDSWCRSSGSRIGAFWTGHDELHGWHRPCGNENPATRPQHGSTCRSVRTRDRDRRRLRHRTSDGGRVVRARPRRVRRGPPRGRAARDKADGRRQLSRRCRGRVDARGPRRHRRTYRRCSTYNSGAQRRDHRPARAARRIDAGRVPRDDGVERGRAALPHQSINAEAREGLARAARVDGRRAPGLRRHAVVLRVQGRAAVGLRVAPGRARRTRLLRLGAAGRRGDGDDAGPRSAPVQNLFSRM